MKQGQVAPTVSFALLTLVTETLLPLSHASATPVVGSLSHAGGTPKYNTPVTGLRTAHQSGLHWRRGLGRQAPARLAAARFPKSEHTRTLDPVLHQFRTASPLAANGSHRPEGALTGKTTSQKNRAAEIERFWVTEAVVAP